MEYEEIKKPEIKSKIDEDLKEILEYIDNDFCKKADKFLAREKKRREIKEIEVKGGLFPMDWDY